MKHRVICLLIAISLFVTDCNINVAIGEKVYPMGFFEDIQNFLYDYSIHRFLENRGILADDKEAYDYTDWIKCWKNLSIFLRLILIPWKCPLVQIHRNEGIME